MTIRAYQHTVQVLGGVTVTPGVRAYQHTVQVLGTPETPPVALSYVATGGLTLSGISDCVPKVKYTYISSGNLTLSGDSDARFAIPMLSFSYVASGNISIGSTSLCNLKLQYISTNNNLILSGNSNINVDYFGPYTMIKVRFVVN
jgi:hypothetical protein